MFGKGFGIGFSKKVLPRSIGPIPGKCWRANYSTSRVFCNFIGIRYSFIILLYGFFCTSFFAPGDPVVKIRQALASYYRNYPQEKVYLQFDRHSYTGGETIWFSGFVSYLLKPSGISNVLYVELFNANGLIIDRCMLQAEKGSVYGDLRLPAGLKEGKYFVRAYTAWMLNFNPELFFYQEIAVADKGKAVREKTTAGHADFFVQFFPESGNLVSRLTSLVVFKAIDTNGLPVHATGKIFNSLGDTIAVIKTAHEGMGSFVIHCSPQTLYTALVTANGITKKIPLPLVQSSGIVLHTETRINNISDSIFFHISRSSVNKAQFENLILCAQMENHFSVTKIHFDESTFNDPLDSIITAPYPLLLNNFDAGILQLSVLTQSGNILAKRLVFLHHGQPGFAQLSPVAINMLKDKNDFTISLPDDYKGTIAVAVTDAEAAPESTNSTSIRPGMLLSANTNVIIHAPAWYFDAINPETTSALDKLLVTCSSARMELQKILNNDYQPIKYLPEKSIALKGRAFDINGSAKTPLANGSVFLIIKAGSDSLTKPFSVTTDAEGLFIIPDLSFHDTANIYVQTGVKTDGRTTNTIAVAFTKSIFDSISQNRFVTAPFLLNRKFFSNEMDSLAGNIKINSQSRMLENVTVTAKVKTHTDSELAKYANGIFANPGSWAQTLDLTNDQIIQNSDQDVLAWLNGKVAGLNYSYSNGKPLIYWRFSNVIAGLSGIDQIKLNAPAFFLNEALLSAGPEGYDAAIGLLSGIRMADVALIRVFKPGTMPNVPDNGPHGSIAIYLKNGTEMNKPSTKINFEKTTITGYRKPRHFYDVNDDPKKNTTLYWNPFLQVNSITHKAIFSVHDYSDVKPVRIIIEGLDKDGRMAILNQVIQ